MQSSTPEYTCIKIVDGVKVMALKYFPLELKKCGIGNFYDPDTNECFGKNCYDYLSFVDSNDKLLSSPIITIPIWKN